MSGAVAAHLTEVKRDPRRESAIGSGGLLAVFFPVLVVGLATVALAVIAALLGWHRQEMLLAGSAIGALLAPPGLFLLYRQRRDRTHAQQALRNIEARVGGIVESAMDAIITVDEGQRVVLFNRAAEEVFRCGRDEALGASLDRFVPARFRAAHRGLVRQFGEAHGGSRRMGHARVVMGLRRDGSEFPIEASISQVEEGGHRLYTVILRDVSGRVAAEEALRQSREDLREMARAASAAREQEKSRIARELHDELGQALTALKIEAAFLRDQLGGAPAAVKDKLASMQSLLDGTVAAARRISSDLRPLMLDDLGLTAATEWLAQNFTNRTGIPCELVIAGGDLDLPDPYATAVFRVMQECLTNVAKHAAATQVEATLERHGDEVTLTVHDNGRGFTASGERNPGSFGLVGMKERALLLDGTLEVESAPGRGTRIELHIPLASAEAG